MVKRLYLDGCSLTYGQGLSRQDSLGALFHTRGEYLVLDQSRPGKSNIAIAFDTYQNFREYDTFVLGFTYSSRFGLKYHDQNLDFFPGFHGNGLGLEPANLDIASTEVHKYFYSVFGSPYCDNLSDMLIDTLINFLISQNKKVLGFSWEKRKTVCQLEYPYIGPASRLNDGHLNVKGTEQLFDFLQNIINE
jgi:hypothetical protein